MEESKRILVKSRSIFVFYEWIELLYLSIPEIISAALLVLLPIILDLYFINTLQNTTASKALSISNNFLHLFSKLSESIAVITTAKIGFCNGAKDSEGLSSYFFNTLLTAATLGLLQIILNYSIINWYLNNISIGEEVCFQAKAFLSLQSVAIFFSFIFMALVGFFRGIKNSFIPMCGLLISVITFIAFDYFLILGKWGFPSMGLLGSAIAGIARYFSGTVFLIGYLIYKQSDTLSIKKISSKISFKKILEIISSTLPVMIDKSVIAIAYLWLFKLIAPLGTYSLLTMEVIKNLERLAFVPAVGFAHTTNFIISNNFGANNFGLIWKNLRKILFVAIISITIVLLFFCIKADWLVSFFDPNNLFRAEATFVLRVVSGLVLLDVCQVIFAATLRALGRVYTVMFTRILLFSFFYIPTSLFVSKLNIQSLALKIMLIYGLFYITISIIGIIFMIQIWNIINIQQEK